MRVWTFLLVAVLAGCGRKHDLVGYWQSSNERAIYEFRSDGTYRVWGGSPGVGELTWKLEGNTLNLAMPGPSGRGIDLMPVKIEWKGSDHFLLLSAAGHSGNATQGEEFQRLTASEREAALKLFDQPLPSNAPHPAKGSPLQPSQGVAESATCLSNLRQLATASLLYAQDYDGILPGSSWSEQTYPYAKNWSYYTCPSLSRMQIPGGYSLNVDVARQHLNEIEQPTNTPMIFETASTILGSVQPFTALLATPRHNGSRNIAYADGHAREWKAGTGP